MKLKLEKIHTHPDLQAREKMNEEMIELLAEVYREQAAGVHFWTKGITVFKNQEDGNYYILDGHHRLEAAKTAGLESITVEIPFDVHTIGDALKRGIHKNAINGQNFKPGDIRRAVELLLKYYPNMTVEEVAHALHRGKSTIYQHVRQLSDAGKLNLPETRKGKDGKERPTKYADREKKTEEDHPGRLSSLPPLQGRGIEPKSVFCGNAGCRCQCSASYLEDLKKSGSEPGDWVFGDLDPEKAYCSEDCRSADEEKVLEKEADRILKTAESVKPAELSKPAEEEETADAAPCPICGRRPNICIDGSITCWGDHKSTGPDHELAIRVGKKRTREQVLELWNRLASSF